MEQTTLADGTPCTRVHTLVVGSGAAGLNAAVQLHAGGVEDLLIVTEGLDKGTSINTGSDKQTYYKIGMYGSTADSIEELADSFYAGGSMHGDIALCEASLSGRGFLNLVNLGVPFPRDSYGQYVGYKTDHDPRRRATSVGPYTSREMCRCLIKEVQRRKIAVREQFLAASLVTVGEGDAKRACGVVGVDIGGDGKLCAVLAENVVFAVGGPGGLYHTSVYPIVHSGAIGVALMAGARAQGLPESQYGMASTKFRWNVSGTYMQVIPRFVSTAADGTSDEQEFMRPFFASAGDMNSAIFLKGYQWPFDPRKVVGGSSIVDILVYVETVLKGRRVFLDYRSNGTDFEFATLSEEAREYLERSEACLDLPIDRLQKMNQPAIDLYLDHGIDVTKEPLEIAVCAQHNNGGLAGNHWWESANVSHLFPVGEVNGSHGVYRPGGSALNSGQVGSFRAAEFIVNKYDGTTLDVPAATAAAEACAKNLSSWIDSCSNSKHPWADDLDVLRRRMTKAAAHIRSAASLDEAIAEARKQWKDVCDTGLAFASASDVHHALNTRQLCFAHLVYLEAVKAAVGAGVGSRGSALVLANGGTRAHADLGDEWTFAPEDESFKGRVLETAASPDGSVSNAWVDRRPVPSSDAWFETAWAEFREGRIYE